MTETTSTVAALLIAAATIELQPGEHYAGIVLNADGSLKHHLVLMAEKPAGDLNWQAAKDWAASVGGSLPDRQEAALIYANCKPHVEPEWHWTSEEHAIFASVAWGCNFISGYQSDSYKSYEGAARAVRRLTH